VRILGLVNRFFGRNKNPTLDKPTIQMVTEEISRYYSWNGNLYQSDIIRSCIRPKVKAAGKLVPKHIRNGQDGLRINPDPYMRFLLEEPNPYMSGQMLQEKLATQLGLNGNAFALIYRDENGYPFQIYPVPAVGAEAIRSDSGNLFIKFRLRKGVAFTVPYSDVIHLRQDYNEDDMFGDNPFKTLEPLMEIVNTTDQGIVNAIKNSAVIKWILKFKSVLHPKDRDLQVSEFVKNYLSISNEGGAAASDPRYDIEQVKPQSYVPNAAQMKETLQRIYSFFNTNEKIIQSKYDEDEWTAYYESELEPLAMQLSNEYSRKLFTRKERGHGNKIIFEASTLQYASMTTKLNLVQMVDRGALTPNEWREVLSLGPIADGDTPIRRLDTAAINKLGAFDNAINQLKELINSLEGGGKGEETKGQPIESPSGQKPDE
jgi:HK97 family phage portal protein